MQEKQINVTVENGVKQLVIRHGEAEEINNSICIEIEGDITAPRRYAEVRSKQTTKLPDGRGGVIKDKEGNIIEESLIDPRQAICEIQTQNMAIKFDTVAQNEKAPKIYGEIKNNPDLMAFKINNTEEEKYNPKSLYQFLQQRKMFFTDDDGFSEYTQVLTGLRSFSAKTDSNVVNDQDERGNKNLVYQKNILESSTPESFILNMPLFLNDTPQIFKVHIGQDIRSGACDLWLYSPELFALITNRRDKLLKYEAEWFVNNISCPVIWS